MDAVAQGTRSTSPLEEFLSEHTLHGLTFLKYRLGVVRVFSISLMICLASHMEYSRGHSSFSPILW